MESILMYPGWNFNYNPIGEILNQSIVGDIHSCFFITGISQNPFNNGHNTLSQLQCDLGLDSREIRLIKPIKIENPLVIGHVICPLDVFPKVTITRDGHQTEFLQDYLENTSLRPGFF